jgi:hypothetical protein
MAQRKGLKHLMMSVMPWDSCHHGRDYNHSEAESPLTQMTTIIGITTRRVTQIITGGPEFNYEFYDENLDTFPARKFGW